MMSPWLVVIGFLLYSPVHGAPCIDGGIDCMLELRKIYREQLDLSRLTGNKVLYMNYSVSATPRDKSQQVVRDEYYVYTSQSKFALQGNKMETFQDDHAVLSVLLTSKVVIINEPVDFDIVKTVVPAQMNAWHDSLFVHARLDQCMPVKSVDGRMGWFAKISLDEIGIKQFRLTSMEFQFDEQKKIMKCTMFYPQREPYYKVEYLFKTIDFDSKTRKLSITALANVFGGNGKVHPRYNGFRIIDNRKNKK